MPQSSAGPARACAWGSATPTAPWTGFAPTRNGTRPRSADARGNATGRPRPQLTTERERNAQWAVSRVQETWLDVQEAPRLGAVDLA